MLAAIIGLSGGPVFCRVFSVRRFAPFVEGVTVEVIQSGPVYAAGDVTTYSTACVVPLETGLAWRASDWSRYITA